jgi:hypothetical protein
VLLLLNIFYLDVSDSGLNLWNVILNIENMGNVDERERSQSRNCKQKKRG